ncbi:MAG: Xaa-Pro peptidase family protein [Candidatus Omnitrophica bacterium]|nr:Xaa-Pro peptidase family protein [Candidatus Omnitrophota bacterium]
MNYLQRQHKLKKLLDSNHLDALLIRKKQNIAYLTGIRGDDSILLISKKKNYLITDSRYKEEYKKGLKNCSLEIAGSGETGHIISYAIEAIAKKTRSRRIGFESNNFSHAAYAGLKKRLKRRALRPVTGMVESLRMIKDKDEIACIRKACQDGCEIMNYGVRSARPLLRESELRQRIESYIAKKNLKRADFEMIIASGRNASMPHASCSSRKIRKREMVVIDLGAMNYGYNSDLTRTVFLGKIDRTYSRIYSIVKHAQKKAIEAIRPGIKASYIDHISRQYISLKGLGKYFIHSLGHGIGLETHEGPRLSKKSKDILKKNMTVTVEPGIYIPGWGGVRIEDVALVTNKGCEVLTKRSRK